MNTGPPPITVIVPVYLGLDEVRSCLASIGRHAGATDVPFEVVVVDDASPEPGLGEELARFASDPFPVPVTLLRNRENQGFVRSCNRALREAPGDVVLLNSDTVVTAGWLDRMAAAAGEADVATVTPLTNFGSICTMPASVIAAFELDGPAPRIDDCAAFVERHSLRHRPAVISGVGFCLYITREALERCGLFDEETFGLGYGEEVDFCLRASGLGFRHLVEDATFVFHRGAVSFNERRADGLKRSSELLHHRYPHFRRANRRERADDPLRLPFTALELGLTARRADRPHVLQILHSRPGELGGTEKHFWQLLEVLFDEFDVSVLQPADSGFLLTTLWDLGEGAPTRQEMLLPGERGRSSSVDDPAAAAALQTVLDLYTFDAVHIQNIVRHSLAPLEVLADFDGPVSCSVRDLYLACPHHWLLYRNRQSCGIPDDLSVCARCLPETRGLDVGYLQAFRQTVASRLDTIDHWVFATRSAVDYFSKVYDLDPARTVVIEHGAVIDHDRAIRAVDRSRVLDEPLRLAFVGIGWAKKGLPAVNDLAESFADTDIEFHHFGELRGPISPLIRQHGHYDNNVLPELLRRAGIQVVLLPGPFVETFGHVMTEALVAGIPVIGHRHGALGERIRRHEVGWTIDPEDIEGIRELIENLDRGRLEVLRATRRAVEVDLHSIDTTRDDYAALYRPGPAARFDRSTPSTRRSMSESETERLRRELRAMATLNRQLQARLEEANRRTDGRAGRRSRTMADQARSVRDQVERGRAAIERRGVVPTGKEVGRRALRRARSASRR